MHQVIRNQTRTAHTSPFFCKLIYKYRLSYPVCDSVNPVSRRQCMRMDGSTQTAQNTEYVVSPGREKRESFGKHVQKGSSLSSVDTFIPVLPQHLPSPGLSSSFDDSEIIDEVNVDLSFPPPGTDTISNASPFEFILGQHVFWPTREGEKHGIVEHIADCDYVLSSPSSEMVGSLPPAGKGMRGGGGFDFDNPGPYRVHGKISAPYYVVRGDDGKQRAFRAWELATYRRPQKVKQTDI